MHLLHILITLLFITLGIEGLSQVYITGAMKDVMWNGELAGKIDLDTIADKAHLYGLGPVEKLAGELLVMDGKCYRSYVVSETEMKVIEGFDVKAPFFGYAKITEWQEVNLPANITTIADLEVFIDKRTLDAERPFFFKVRANVASATIHIVNLPEGATVASPDEAHQGLTKYQLQHEEVDILGFFSTEHKAVLTHHDTFVHLHLITANRQKMGHLDEVQFESGTSKLYLPAKSNR